MITLNFGLANVTDQPIRNLPTGLYRAQITKAEIVAGKDGREPQLEIGWKVAEGEHAGTERKEWLGTTVKDPTNEKSVKGLIGVYADLLLSVGFTADQIKATTMQIAQVAQAISGRVACVRWQDGDRDAGVRPRANFIKPAQYALEMEDMQKVGADEYARVKNEAAAKAAQGVGAAALSAVPGLGAPVGLPGLPAVGLPAAAGAVPGLPGLPGAPAAAPFAAATLPAAPAVPAAPSAPSGLPGLPAGLPAGLAGLAGLPGMG